MFKRDGKSHVAWIGVDNPFCGYGSSSRNIVRHLLQNDVVPHDVTTCGDKAEKCAVGIGYAAISLSFLERLPSPYRILYTMFEADRWPGEWVAACNCANQVWVPSEFCRDSLIASGCEAPIVVIPLGVDTADYYPPRTRDADPTDNTFVFGYAGSASTRKGYDLLIRAFQEEFTGSENVRLMVQTSNALPALLKIKDARIDARRAQVDTDTMRGFYQSLDCFVMPSRGEGFGLTPLEAMACGTPAIVTDWGGCRDYLDTDCLRVAIDGLEGCPNYHNNIDGHFARPSIASLRYCMRWAFDNHAKLAEMGKHAAKRVANDWTYQRTAMRIKSFLEEVNPRERVEVEPVDVVVWRGNSPKVTTKAGGFTRGIPRELTPEQSASINLTDRRFRLERRYRRK